jgi:hypothetical protein
LSVPQWDAISSRDDFLSYACGSALSPMTPSMMPPAIVDDIMLVSGANLTDDAFNRNFEMGLLVKNEELLVTAKNYFDSLIAA